MFKLYLTSFLVLYYLVFSYFFVIKDKGSDYPVLRDRLGTILSHSSDIGGGNREEHLYCFYPKEIEVGYQGEYLLKRADKIDDCRNWLGMSFFNEGSWVSEREKLWWYQGQQEQEGLAKIEEMSHYNN